MDRDLKSGFEARAVHITNISIKHENGEHPFDVIQINIGDGMIFVNRAALEMLQQNNFDWSNFKQAVKALPKDIFSYDLD
ncbi:MAG: hypothetical protein LRY76_03740 [Alphaproteobacteria bacterium]|nr:hypothetical protein [Alphaproteobacteria bacterium]MCD8570633.1 hypothetical protein [Alphaproteobacteria bacterium]